VLLGKREILMSNQVKTQADKLWKTITDPSTANTYQNTVKVTWNILKETGLLAWLVVCLGLVLGEWIWKTGYRTGWSVRGWVNNLDKPSPDKLLNETGKSLTELSKTVAASAIATAKNQLGIESNPEPPLVMSAPRSAPTSVSAPTEAAKPAAATVADGALDAEDED
jgi:hypothetical protein